MEAKQIAAAPVEGIDALAARHPDVRLWLVARRDEPQQGFIWDLFHDGDRVGTHARVGRARIKIGDGEPQEVALKLRRDRPLGRLIDPKDAYLRFWREHLYHQKLRTRDGSESIPLVLTAKEHRGPGYFGHPDALPPCVVCLKACHAVPLRRAGAILREGDARGFERRLTGENPREHFSLAEHEEDVLNDSLGADDSACGRCPLRGRAPSACREHLLLINFFPNQFLILPVWESSLETFLGEWNSEEPLKYPRQQLAQRLGAAHDVARGLKILHETGIWHHDLNPENILLHKEGNRHHAAIIDLGMSSEAVEETDAASLARLEASDLWPRRLSFAAWECRQDALEEPVLLRFLQHEAEYSVFQLVQSSLAWFDHDPPVCPGDVLVPFGPSASDATVLVRAVNRERDLLVLINQGYGRVVTGGVREFVVQRQRGPAADLFSLGMIMIALLLDHPQGRPIRHEIERAQDVVATLAEGRTMIAPFELATVLLTQPNAFSATGRRLFLSRLARYGPHRDLARDALGLAFSLVLRGPAACGAVTIDRRKTNALATLRSVCDQLAEIHKCSKPENVAAPTARQAAVAAQASRRKGLSRRREETLPDDWRHLLPFWKRLKLDGDAQLKLLKDLDAGTFQPPPHSREKVLAIQDAHYATQSIADFLKALIVHRSTLPDTAWIRIKQYFGVGREMPAELTQNFIATLSALDRLDDGTNTAQSWIDEIVRVYGSARDHWLQCRSNLESAYLGSSYLTSMNRFWENDLFQTDKAWRSDRVARVERLRKSLQDFRSWWPVAEPGSKTEAWSILDTHLNSAAERARALLDDEIAWLSRSPLGPAGEVQAIWARV